VYKYQAMARFFKKQLLSKGTRPGSLIFVGEQRTDRIRIRIFSFNETELEESEVSTIGEAANRMKPGYMNWINIDGLHDPAIIAETGKAFNIQNLVLEDVMNTVQRPRYDAGNDQLAIISKFLIYQRDTRGIETDQVSFIAGKDYLITFQERPGTHFDAVRERIRNTSRREWIIYPDYLAYALLDSIVDNYMEIIAELGAEIEAMEAEVLHHPGKATLQQIYRLRSDLNYLRKTILPHREIAFDLLRKESALVRKETHGYLKDLQDHIVLSHEIIETYLTLIADQLNIYNSNLSNRANEIMKTLTIFASIFIPLTFIAGIYGMNFKVIPELQWEYGYLYFWGIIVLMGIGLFIYFRRKKWF